MATTERDYYEILELQRSASESEIKKAFRRLARDLHPDVSELPDADARFRQVAEAYEVLSNPERRDLYDRLGHAGLRSGGYTPGHFDFGSLSDIFAAFFGDDLFAGTAGARRGRGADLAAEVEIDLVDAARGTSVRVPFEVAVTCDRCQGDGAEPGADVSTCGVCGGIGHVQQVSRSVFGEFVRTRVCPSCDGTGRLVSEHCTKCRGAGRVVEERARDVEIPPGIHDGQRIRLSGEGHAGQLGGRAGDVYVRARVRPDPRFVRDGNDLLASVDLTMTQAALGTTLSVPTIDGDEEVDFAPGVQPGAIVVLRGKGMPVLQGRGRGDHRLLVNVLVPAALSDEQRRLLEEFAGLEDDGTYRTDEGLFAKLKSAFR
ncbi:MAG: J domain-containing protein [Gaiellaceae bacterium]